MNNIEALEQRYQALYRKFQAEKIDEAAFVAQVDSLQFQDDWGRYWMIGAQTGSWHYYDGQTWHQADPHEADKLPFMDDQGRYWQRGAKSGDWYYYQPDTDEWVKPSREDGVTPPKPARQPQTPTGVSARSRALPDRARSPLQPTPAGPQPPAQQVDSELFQDDEGRYWSIGAKTGQWYFYDHEGWHPAHEFQARTASARPGPQPDPHSPPPYQPPAPQTVYQAPYNPQQTQVYGASPSPAQSPQPSQFYAYPSPSQPGPHPTPDYPGRSGAPASPPAVRETGQAYVTQPAPGPGPQQPQVASPAAWPGPTPGQEQPPAPAPSAPAATPAPSPQESQAEAGPAPAEGEGLPEPPQGRTRSGAWYYLDGDRWYKYSTDEPADDVSAPDPKKVVDQKAQKVVDQKAQEEEAEAEAEAEAEDVRVEVEPKKVKAKEPPVEAELFAEDDEPPPEVVDVEVVTVIEAEPEIEPDDEPAPAPEPPHRRVTAAYAPPPRREQEVRPRRATRQSRPVDRPAADDVGRPPRQSRRPASEASEASRESGRPAAPRKREAAHEPTIIIPTDTAASNIASKTGKKPASRPVKPASRPVKPASRPVKPASRPVKPASRPVHVTPEQQRRARENTVPVESAKRGAVAGGPNVSANPPGLNRNVTQSMPQVVRSGPERVSSPARAVTAPLGARAAAQSGPASEARPARVEPEKEGYTLGDILRSFPSTLWTFAGGMVVLFIFAVIIFALWFGLRGGSGESEGLSAVARSDMTPTLSAAAPNATPTPGPTPTVAPEPFTPPEPADYTSFSSRALDFTLDYPENWATEDDQTLAIFSPSEEGLDPDDLDDAAFWISKTDDDEASIADLLADVLSLFPPDSKTENEGTINIASQPWTTVQIRFEDEDLGGQGIATLAVTTKDEAGYTLVAVAPAETWNSMQPMYQEMINSFRFGARQRVAADSTRTAAPRTTAEADESDDEGDADDEEAEEAEAAEEDEETAEEDEETPTPEVEATPVVHIIQSGDTLLGIANQYGVDVELLTTENGVENPNNLTLGQELIIPFTEEELAAYDRRTGGGSASGGRSTTAPDSDEEEAEEAAEEDGEDGETAADSDDSGTETDSPADAAAETAPPDETEASEAAPLSGRIAYPAFNPGTNVYDLWVVDVASGEQNVIVGEASQPAFNRDGSLLAYRSWILDDRGIFFRDFVGGRGGQVSTFVEDGLPTWSPDGYSFAFVSRREGDRVARLFRGNQEGNEDIAIGFQGEYVSAFPDGRLIVKGCSITGDCGLYTIGANGGSETKISSELSDTAPAVSPDGDKIAFMSSGRGATDWEIWVMNADGSNAQRLTQSRSNEGLPAWSPDGKSIAYVSDQGGLWAIWVMNADGSNQRKLVNMSGSPDGTVLHAGNDSRGWLEERISWAP